MRIISSMFLLTAVLFSTFVMGAASMAPLPTDGQSKFKLGLMAWFFKPRYVTMDQLAGYATLRDLQAVEGRMERNLKVVSICGSLVGTVFGLAIL